MAERLPVPVGTLPADTRLALVLFDIDSIAQRAAHERAVKDYATQALREAFTYKPTLAIDVEQALRKSGELLLEKGHQPKERDDDEPKGKTLDQAVAEKLKTYDYRAPVSPKARDEVTRSIVRQIARVVHPDSNDELANVADTAFADTDRTRTLTRASEISRASETSRAEDAQRLLLETMPRYYLHMVKTLMADGLSLGEIVAQNPSVVAEMENLRWIAFSRFTPADSISNIGRIKSFEDADREAARVRRKPEHHARTIACGMVGGLFNEVMDFGTNRGLTPEQEREFKEIQNFMQRAFGYVGGTGEFVVQQGDRLLTETSRNLGRRLEEFIRALPDKLFTLTEAVTAEELDATALKQALDGVRYAVASVNSSAGRYGSELEDEANGRRRYTGLESLYSSEKYFRKENLFNDIIKKKNF